MKNMKDGPMELFTMKSIETAMVNVLIVNLIEKQKLADNN